MNLQITRKTIKKIVMRLTCQALKHLINEWQGKMIFFGCLVQPPMINADSSTVLHSCGDKLILLIIDHCEACLLRHYHMVNICIHVLIKLLSV